MVGWMIYITLNWFYWLGYVNVRVNFYWKMHQSGCKCCTYTKMYVKHSKEPSHWHSHQFGRGHHTKPSLIHTLQLMTSYSLPQPFIKAFKFPYNQKIKSSNMIFMCSETQAQNLWQKFTRQNARFRVSLPCAIVIIQIYMWIKLHVYI